VYKTSRAILKGSVLKFKNTRPADRPPSDQRQLSLVVCSMNAWLACGLRHQAREFLLAGLGGVFLGTSGVILVLS
jgi:hypothetical protein